MNNNIQLVELELKELILDEEFCNLQNLVDTEVNLMEILKVSHKELQHSNFLAWLFDPNANHKLGDLALKEFIKIYFKENQFQNLWNQNGLSVFDFVQLDFDDLEIRREYKNIDLIFLSQKNQFCIIIENKIHSTEQNGQLEKYRKIVEDEYNQFKHKIFIYLSLEDQSISESEQDQYLQLNYEHIIKLIQCIIWNQQRKISDKTKFVLEQYLQTLQSMLNKNEEIEEIAQQLYKKYKSAFDLVFKYSAPVGNDEIWNTLKDLILHEGTLKPFQSNKTYIRFQPKYFYENLKRLENSGLISQTDDLSNNWMFLFEFTLKNDQVFFAFKIGPGEQDAREKLYSICKRHNNIFTKITNGTLRAKWHQVFQKQIITPIEYQNYLNNDSVNIEQIIEKRFKELIDEDLPKILWVIDKELE